MNKFKLIFIFLFLFSVNSLFSQTILFEEGFETGIGNWTVYDEDADGEQWGVQGITFWAHTGDKCAGVTTGASSDNEDWLISPQINISEASFLSYWLTELAEDQTAEIEILISTTGTQISDFTLIETNSVPYLGYDMSSYIYTEYQLDLTGYVGQDIYIAWKTNANNNGMVVLDDISIATQAISYPECYITSPTDGTHVMYHDEVTFEIDATIASGTITKVELFTQDYYGSTDYKIGEDTEAPYEIVWDTDEYGLGGGYANTVWAVATSSFGTENTNDNQILIYLDDFYPECSITYPNNNQQLFIGSIIPFEAEANDNVPAKDILSLSFYIDNELVYEDNTAPYDYEWNTEGLTAGTYELKVIAEDEHGNTDESIRNIELINDFSGNRILWNKVTGTKGMDEGFSVIQTSDGGYLTAGLISDNEGDGFITKYDQNMNILWTATAGQENTFDNFNSVVETFDQTGNSTGYLAVGNLGTEEAFSIQIYIVKFDTDGNIEWEKEYGENDVQDEGFDVMQLSDGNFAVLGYKGYSYGGMALPDVDAWIIKLDQNGDEIWNQTYGRYDIYDFADEFVETEQGGFAFAGYASNEIDETADGWLVITDENGDVLLDNTYGEQDEKSDIFYGIDNTNDGGYILAGYTFSFGNDYSQWWIQKTDSEGNMQWQSFYGGEINERANSVIQTYGGNYIATGYKFVETSTPESYTRHIAVAKFDNSGNLIWEETYGTDNGEEEANCIIQDENLDYVLTGYSTSFGMGSADIWTMKLDADETVSINENQQKIEISVYPNPTTDIVNLSGFQNLKGLTITDITGKTFENKSNIKTQNFSIDISNYPAGIYLLEIETEDGVYTEKIIKY